MATIDLLTDVSYAPRREDYITQQTACRMAPAGTPHPMWDAFLFRVTAGDLELIKFLQRFIGYCRPALRRNMCSFSSTAPGETARERSSTPS